MAFVRELFLDQGSTFSANVNVYNPDGTLVDLSSYSARSMFRKHYASTNSHTFTANINVNNNVIVLSMNAATTANVTPGRYMYDVEIYNDAANVVIRVLEGLLTVTPEITR